MMSDGMPLKNTLKHLTKGKVYIFITVLMTYFWPGTQNSLNLTEYATYARWS